ncbi:MAG: tRNA-dihydrouridine synthase [Planctomycetaceae bacterium]|nr:tRNA-dihydrouridine synthase [Planctomycetaceae bacterium]
MRTIARRLGAPYTICEVMIDSFVNSLKDRERTRHFLMVTDEDHPVGAQLMGADPAEFPAAARRLVAAGFDVIDINFGCPVRKVLGRCRGGYHLSQPDIALEIVRRVRESVPHSVPVTVKMRRGIDDSDRSREQFFQILAGSFDAGVAAVTVHGRTVEQRYQGLSRWDFLREVRQQFPYQTILGSGDLFSAEDCVRMLHQTGVNGVTAARGSIGNPWIFAQTRELLAGRPLPPPPTVHEQRDVVREHLELALSVYPERKAVAQLRKFGMRYADWHPNGEHVRADFIRSASLDDFRQVLSRQYAIDQSGRYPVLPGRPKPPATVCDE